MRTKKEKGTEREMQLLVEMCGPKIIPELYGIKTKPLDDGGVWTWLIAEGLCIGGCELW